MKTWFLLLLFVALPAAAQHAGHEPTPRPPEKPGGVVKEVRRFAYLAAEGATMRFTEPTTVRYEPRHGPAAMFERAFAAGQSASCSDATFSAVGKRNGYAQYVCTKLVETITLRELLPQVAGVPYVDRRLDMPPKRGFDRAILGPQIEQIVPRPGGGGEFRISCFVSRMGFEDPILAPGREFWHHHTFAGNTRTDRYTVDMRDDPASGLCAGGNINRSAYWFPSVIDTRFGMPIAPEGVAVYYKGAPDALPPPGLRMLGGDPMRTIPRDRWIVPVSVWNCYVPGKPTITQGLLDEIPVACPVGARLVWTVTFPDCWDGVNEDSPDHRAHVHWRAHNKPGMTFLPNGCPSTHPKRLFDLAINVHFVIQPGDDVSRWRLSSDNYEWSKPAGYSAHADWWNGWDMEFLAAVKAGCHDKGINCGQDNAPDGRRLNSR